MVKVSTSGTAHYCHTSIHAEASARRGNNSQGSEGSKLHEVIRAPEGCHLTVLILT